MRKYILPLVAFLMIIGYLTILNQNSREINQINREGAVYHRTTACILSVPLATRTPGYIDNCYSNAEKKYNIEVDRFGE